MIPEPKSGIHAILIHQAEQGNPVAAEIAETIPLPPSPVVESFREMVAKGGISELRTGWKESPMGKQLGARAGGVRGRRRGVEGDRDLLLVAAR